MFGIEALVDHPGNLDVAAKGDPGDAVVCLAQSLAERSRREAYREALDAHSEEFGGQKVPEFMDEDQDAERDDKIECGIENLHSPWFTR